jgi:hypothetical protein
MKTVPVFCALGFLVVASNNGQAQGAFQNLNFEAANIAGYGTGGNIPISVALPGWTCTYYNTLTGQTYSGFPGIWYDGISLGGYAISINDSALFSGYVPLEGNFDVTVMGGNGVSAIISQTGLIPIEAATLLLDYSATVNPVISLNAQPISLVALGGGRYAGDIAAYAGQTVTLSLSAPPGGPSFFTVDSISLSSSAIPEPSAFGLTGLGFIVMGLCRRLKSTLSQSVCGRGP